MKILIEAFSSTMPENIRKWMQQYGDHYRSKMSKADSMTDFDPATAEFEDVSHMGVKELRDKMKSGFDVIFAEVPDPAWGQLTTLAIYYDAKNTTNSLKLVGYGAEKFKEKSFKWIIENAKSVYATTKTSDVSAKRTDRVSSRKGLISRSGQSAQNTDPRFSFDGQNWKQDASGYWYDANRLVNKLAKMHADDVGYYFKKAANIFVNMANLYTNKVTAMAQDTDNLDLSTFGDGSFERISRDGQRLLVDAGRRMNNIKEQSEYYANTLEQVNKKRAEKGADPISEEQFNERQQDTISSIVRLLSEIEEKNRDLKTLIS